LLDRLLLGFLIFDLGPMVTNDTAGCRAGHGMMARDVSGDAAHSRAFQATLG
jgi:hypothetical protein